MEVILAEYESAQYQEIYGDDPDAMKNIFNVDNEGNFVDEALVQGLLQISLQFNITFALAIVCLKIQLTCILHCLLRQHITPLQSI